MITNEMAIFEGSSKELFTYINELVNLNSFLLKKIEQNTYDLNKNKIINVRSINRELQLLAQVIGRINRFNRGMYPIERNRSILASSEGLTFSHGELVYRGEDVLTQDTIRDEEDGFNY